MLVEAGRRLRALVRTADTVSRYGGDEFTVLAEDVGDVEAAQHLGERIAERALAALRRRAEAGGERGRRLHGEPGGDHSGRPHPAGRPRDVPFEAPRRAPRRGFPRPSRAALTGFAALTAAGFRRRRSVTAVPPSSLSTDTSSTSDFIIAKPRPRSGLPAPRQPPVSRIVSTISPSATRPLDLERRLAEAVGVLDHVRAGLVAGGLDVPHGRARRRPPRSASGRRSSAPPTSVFGSAGSRQRRRSLGQRDRADRHERHVVARRRVAEQRRADVLA